MFHPRVFNEEDRECVCPKHTSVINDGGIPAVGMYKKNTKPTKGDCSHNFEWLVGLSHLGHTL